MKNFEKISELDTPLLEGGDNSQTQQLEELLAEEEFSKQQTLNLTQLSEEAKSLATTEQGGQTTQQTSGTTFEATTETKKKNDFHMLDGIQKWGKKFLITTAFTASSLVGFSKGEKSGEEDKNKKAKVENTNKEKGSSLEFYKGGIEKTPTGKSNAFENNEYEVTTQDVLDIAKELHFDITNNLSFQRDMFNYLEKNNPELIKKTITEFGLPNAGNLEDGVLGARVAFTVNLIKIELQKTPNHTPEFKIPTKEIIEPQPKTDFSFNIRGDEPGDKGAYYFFETKQAYEKALSLLEIGLASNTEMRGDSYGGATFNMDLRVFLENIKGKNENEILKALGQPYLRDPKNYKLFKKHTTVSRYEDGIVKN